MPATPTVLSADEVLAILSAHTADLRRFGVKSLGLFGSVARGDDRADSDLDFLVELERHTLDDYLGLAEFLEALLGRAVDLMELEALPAHYAPFVLPDMKYVAQFQG